MSDALILAGDIGGTKSHLGIFRGDPGAPELVAERRYENRYFASLAEVVARFRTDTGLMAERACFGVAGAVSAGESRLPNLGWTLSERDLVVALGMRSVRLLNDLEATALGLATLAPEQRVVLNPGRPRAASQQALIAAGTGLGMATLVSARNGTRVITSEGGHADFAPRTEEEVGLWRFLAARHGHVSVERVVSGPGLANVFDFLRASGWDVSERLRARLEAADRPAVIAQAGLDGESPICRRALELFLAAYGAAAGNLALTALATGGVYLGGGIAPKLLAALPASGFMAAFTDKGRFADLLANIPVAVITEPRTALFGAAAQALREPNGVRAHT